MSTGYTWSKTLKRTKDGLKNTYRRSRDFLSAFRPLRDERQGFSPSKERRIPKSTQMPDETRFFQGKGQSDVQSEVLGETETHDSKDSDKSHPTIPHYAREPLVNENSLNNDIPRSLENRPRIGESRATIPLTKGKNTTNVIGPSSGETLTEQSQTDENPTTERLPDKKSLTNRSLSNAPSAGESSARQSLTQSPLTREPEIEDSHLRGRGSTARPDMEPSNGESSSAPDNFASNTSDPNLPDPSTSGEAQSDVHIGQPEHREDIAQLEHVDDVEQFHEDEDREGEWFEHIEYADQDHDPHGSLPVQEFTNNNTNNRTTSTRSSPAPRTPRRRLATSKNNRLLRLPIEIRLMIYDELLAIPRRISLLQPYREQDHTHPFHSISQVDTELFTRRAVQQRYKHIRPGLGYYDPRTTTFAVRFTDDELCTHRQWGSEHLGAITNFAPRLPRVRQRSGSAGGEGSGRAPSQQQPPASNGNSGSSSNNGGGGGRSRGTALLYGICSPAAKRANFQTWNAIHAQLLQSNVPSFIRLSSSTSRSFANSSPGTSLPAPTTPPPPYTASPSASLFASASNSFSFSSSSSEPPLHGPVSSAIYILELSFPRICSAINVMKALVLGRMAGWRELRRLSVLRIRIRAGPGGVGVRVRQGAGLGGEGAGGREEEEEEEEEEGGGGPLNEVDMVALYSIALTLAEEMERKVLLQRGPWIEIAW